MAMSYSLIHLLASHAPTLSPATPSLPPPRAAGAAFAASQGGHLFKLEDIALGSWLEWAEQQRNFTVQRVREKR